MIVLPFQFIKLKIRYHNNFCDFLSYVLPIVEVLQHKVLCKIYRFRQRFEFQLFLLKRLVYFRLENKKFRKQVLELCLNDHMFGLV